ncbi:MAG TPA: rod shape-determining protein [Thermoanaerobaculia bacterium]|nr:rod shape-determining protein [Thermoanaerobaculia bacterium]
MTPKKDDYLYVGIDLGTSQSSITASTGERRVVRSLVGWPVDMVAKKIVKKPVLIGDEALENRSMLDLHRPLERGLIKEGSERDLAAVRELLDHLLSLVGVKGKDGGAKVRAVVGVPAEAMRVNKQQLRNTLKGMVDSLMVVSEPFAVAYGQDALLHTMIVDIGAGTTDFCVMRGRYPTEEDQRTLSTAGDSVDDQLSKLIHEHYPEAQFTVHMVREWKESHSFVGKQKERVKVQAPVKGKPTEMDITDELRASCESLIEPISETMLDLLAKVDPEYQEHVRNNVLLSGCTSLIDGLPEALERSLREVGGGKVTRVKDPVFAGSDGGLALAGDAADGDWEKLGS